MGNVLWENLEFIRIAENRMEYGPDLAHGMENSTYNSTEKVQYFFKTNTFLFFFILIALVWALFDANENATMWTTDKYTQKSSVSILPFHVFELFCTNNKKTEYYYVSVIRSTQSYDNNDIWEKNYVRKLKKRQKKNQSFEY